MSELLSKSYKYFVKLKSVYAIHIGDIALYTVFFMLSNAQ